MDTNTLHAAEDALLAVLTSGVSPLAQLVQLPRYRRELRTSIGSDDKTIILELDRRGFPRYKSRGKKLCYCPPPIDTEKVRNFLNDAIGPRFYVTAVDDETTYIRIYVKKRSY